MSTLLREIDILKDDAINGRWRGVAINTKIVPAYLDTWEEILIPPDPNAQGENFRASSVALAVVQQSHFAADNDSGTRNHKETTASSSCKAPKTFFPRAGFEAGDDMRKT